MGGNNPTELIDAVVHTDETVVESVETNAIEAFDESFDREDDGFGRQVLPSKPVELSSSPFTFPPKISISITASKLSSSLVIMHFLSRDRLW